MKETVMCWCRIPHVSSQCLRIPPLLCGVMYVEMAHLTKVNRAGSYRSALRECVLGERDTFLVKLSKMVGVASVLVHGM